MPTEGLLVVGATIEQQLADAALAVRVAAAVGDDALRPAAADVNYELLQI